MQGLEYESKLKASQCESWPNYPAHDIVSSIVVIIICRHIVVVCISSIVIVVVVHGDNIVEVDVDLAVASVEYVPYLSLL